MVEKYDKVTVVCQRVKDLKYPHPESVITYCPKCNAEIYIMPHNLHVEPICQECIKYIMLTEEYEVLLRQEDIKKAREHIKNLQKDNNNDKRT
jgi:hypothetical protein